MIEALIELPSHVRQRLMTALRTGELDEPYSPAAIRSALGVSDEAQHICKALTAIAAHGITPGIMAGWLVSLERTAARTTRPDLAWSGPDVPGIHARNTRRVYEEVLGSANRSAIVSTYAFFDGPRAFDTLARRMDALPPLTVSLLLNIQRKRGDTTDSDQLVRRFAGRFWSVDWPGTRRPEVFYDSRSLAPDGPAGVLHAKAAIVDEELLFVTSANLTEAALDRNIELGLLVRDRTLAIAAASRFRGLIARGMLKPLPGN